MDRNQAHEQAQRLLAYPPIGKSYTYLYKFPGNNFAIEFNPVPLSPNASHHPGATLLKVWDRVPDIKELGYRIYLG